MSLLWIIFSFLLPCSGLLHAFGLGYWAPGALVLLVPLGCFDLFRALVQRTLPAWQLMLMLFVVLYGFLGIYCAFETSINQSYILSREAVTILGALSFIGIGCLCRNATTETAARRLMFGVDFTLVCLLVEALSLHHVLPASVKEVINNVFTGRTTSRLQGPTQEASFVAAYLAVLFPYAVYHMNKNRSVFNIGRVVVMVGFLLMILSLQGLFVWVGALAAGWIYFSVQRPKTIIVSVAFASVLLVAGIFFAGTLNVAKTNGTDDANYVSSRITNFQQIKNVSDLLFLDYSVFNRLSAPYYGMVAGVTRPLGVGPGGFGAYYSHKLAAINDPRLETLLSFRFLGDAEDTKSLVIQYIAETGALSLLLLASFYVCWRQRFINAQSRAEKTLCVSLLGCFAIMAINGGSMLNLCFWICLVPLRLNPENETDYFAAPMSPEQ